MNNKKILALIIIFTFFCLTIITLKIAKRETNTNTTSLYSDTKIDSEVRKITISQREKLVKQSSMSLKERFYKETYLLTQERLKDVNKPQTIYGRVDPGIVSELYKSDKEPGVISIMTKKDPRRWASSSMVIDGAYSLGQIEPGEYEVIILNETAGHPAITVQNFEMKKDQPPLRLDLNYGKASAIVRVYDKDGNPVDSDSIELLIGGTANRTTYKNATGIKNGVWRVDHLYEDRYYAAARWNDKKAGGFFELVKGDNEVVLKFKE